MGKEETFYEGFPVGTVVISRAGRDAGYKLVVTANENGMVIVADGKERPLSRPKKKNPKHLIRTKQRITREQLSELTDRSLRRLLASDRQEDIGMKQECE